MQDMPRVQRSHGLLRAVAAVIDVMEEDVGEHDEDRDGRGPLEHAETAEHANRARAPHGHRGVDAEHGAAPMPDEPGAKESDSSHHLAGDARGAGVVSDQYTSDHVGGGAQRNERVGMQTRRVVANLPLEADQRTERQRSEQTRAVVPIQGCHSPISVRSLSSRYNTPRTSMSADANARWLKDPENHNDPAAQS